ncbi:MAG: patatin-like phospholipase family protein [Actinomycetota bacterium]|nr:patatin-like phospholipase family protein [Actinomycetota bacterium]
MNEPSPIPIAVRMDWPRPLAFALSGGGSYGAAQVGMIRALLEHGIVPDLVVGVSVGALNGALLAARPDSAVTELVDLWSRIDRRTIFGSNPFGLVRNLVRDGALCRPSLLGSLIDDHLHARTFADLLVPFAAVVTEASTGAPELLTSGHLRTALLASAAIPGVFSRVTIGDREFLDGGVSANVPIRQAIAFGASTVISLDPSPSTPPSAFPGRIVGGLPRSVNLMIRNQQAHDVKELTDRYTVVSIPSVTPGDVSSFDFTATARLVEASYESTVAAISHWTPSPRPCPETAR